MLQVVYFFLSGTQMRYRSVPICLLWWRRESRSHSGVVAPSPPTYLLGKTDAKNGSEKKKTLWDGKCTLSSRTHAEWFGGAECKHSLVVSIFKNNHGGWVIVVQAWEWKHTHHFQKTLTVSASTRQNIRVSVCVCLGSLFLNGEHLVFSGRVGVWEGMNQTKHPVSILLPTRTVFSFSFSCNLQPFF